MLGPCAARLRIPQLPELTGITKTPESKKLRTLGCTPNPYTSKGETCPRLPYATLATRVACRTLHSGSFRSHYMNVNQTSLYHSCRPELHTPDENRKSSPAQACGANASTTRSRACGGLAVWESLEAFGVGPGRKGSEIPNPRSAQSGLIRSKSRASLVSYKRTYKPICHAKPTCK